MWRRRLAAAALVALIGAAAWWMLRADDAAVPASAARSGAPATNEEPSFAADRKSPRVRAARPDAESVTASDRAASKAANEAAAKKYVERTFVVQTTDGAPVAGARVRFGSPILDDPMDDYGIRRTDAAGRVRLVVMAEGGVFVRAEGFASRVVHLSKNWVTPDVIEMRRPQPVAGIVVDAAARPVSGATVRPDRDVLRPVATLGDGRFRFDDVDPDDWELDLEVTCTGFMTWSGQVHPGDLDVRAQLSRPCSIAGRVVMPDGSPAASAQISASCTADDDGKFELSGLSAGDVVVGVHAEVGSAAFVGEIVAHLDDGETTRDVRVELRPMQTSFVVARIVGPSGAPVALLDPERLSGRGAVTSGGELVVLPMAVPVGSEEEVRFGAARAGDTDYPDFRAWLVTRATATGAPDVVTLPRLMAFEVDVVDADGKPSSLAQPDLVATDPSARTIPTAAGHDSDGQFQFRLAVGTAWRLVVRSDGVVMVSREVTTDELAAGRAVVRITPGATVRVRIGASPPGRVADPWLVLARNDDRMPHRTPRAVSADGRYAIEHVAPGRWEARVVSCGSIVEKTLAIDVPESGELDLGDVVLPCTTTLHGRVVTSDGRPAGGASIEYFDARRISDTNGVLALTRTDGTFDVDVPVGATGDLCVAKTGHGGVVVPLDGTGAPLEVRLGVACTLRVDHHGASGRAPSGSVALMRPGGTALWTPECGYAEHPADRSETFVYRGLAPGRWVVRVHEIDPVIDREVTLVAGETAEVSIDER